jgi:hypothetical protein
MIGLSTAHRITAASVVLFPLGCAPEPSGSARQKDPVHVDTDYEDAREDCAEGDKCACQSLRGPRTEVDRCVDPSASKGTQHYLHRGP